MRLVEDLLMLQVGKSHLKGELDRPRKHPSRSSPNPVQYPSRMIATFCWLIVPPLPVAGQPPKLSVAKVFRSSWVPLAHLLVTLPGCVRELRGAKAHDRIPILDLELCRDIHGVTVMYRGYAINQ
jgi:hypothetical protein